jgi:hypothetical protein
VFACLCDKRGDQKKTTPGMGACPIIALVTPTTKVHMTAPPLTSRRPFYGHIWTDLLVAQIHKEQAAQLWESIHPQTR